MLPQPDWPHRSPPTADLSGPEQVYCAFDPTGRLTGMELIRGRHNLRPRHRGCAVTIGAFDGVHLGHQAVLAHLKEQAVALGVATTVVTFEPLPREYLRPLEAPPRITTLRDKWPLLAAPAAASRLLAFNGGGGASGRVPNRQLRRASQ